MFECAQRAKMLASKNKLSGQVITDIGLLRKWPARVTALVWLCAPTKHIIENSELRLQWLHGQKKHQTQHGDQCKHCKLCKLSCCVDVIGNNVFNHFCTFISPRNCPLWVVKWLVLQKSCRLASLFAVDVLPSKAVSFHFWKHDVDLQNSVFKILSSAGDIHACSHHFLEFPFHCIAILILCCCSNCEVVQEGQVADKLTASWNILISQQVRVRKINTQPLHDMASSIRGWRLNTSSITT